MDSLNRHGRRFGVALVGVLAAGIFAACGSSATPVTTPAARVTGEITVSAASSLGAAFTRIAADFEQQHRGTTVTVNLGPSSTLATQIEQGARADVFAAADPETMQGVVDSRDARGVPRVFARNAMVIVTKPGNPQRVRSLHDLPKVGFVALCGVAVPCGRYAAQVLAGVKVSLPEDHVTRLVDARATIGAVANGDADAAIVYTTDARAVGSRVETVSIPEADNVIARYPIVLLRAGANPALARAFLSEVLSPAGQATLRRFGFLTP